MIVLYLAQFVINVLEGILVALVTEFSFLDTAIDNFTTTLSNLHISQTFVSTIGLSFYFLPMGTIFTLFVITFGLISIQVLISFFRWLIHLGIFN